MVAVLKVLLLAGVCLTRSFVDLCVFMAGRPDPRRGVTAGRRFRAVSAAYVGLMRCPAGNRVAVVKWVSDCGRCNWRGVAVDRRCSGAGDYPCVRLSAGCVLGTPLSDTDEFGYCGRVLRLSPRCRSARVALDANNPVACRDGVVPVIPIGTGDSQRLRKAVAMMPTSCFWRSRGSARQGHICPCRFAARERLGHLLGVMILSGLKSL